MKILVACEESQVVCKAFRNKGHEAYSCDVLPCSGGRPEWHLQEDVLMVLYNNWDMIIAFPPCTYMCKAGARFMYPEAGKIDGDRLRMAMDAREFFMLFYANDACDRICIENPTPLKVVGLPEPTQIIQPYQFGHPYSKRTLLWLKGLPPLVPTCILNKFTPFLPSNTGGFSRGMGGSRGVVHNAKDASKTFPGIALAMAEQWA